MNLVLFLRLAGVCYLGLMCAGLLMPRVVNLKSHVATLPQFVRQLFWVYYSFIALSLVGFAFVTLFLAPELASGTPLARAVCVFLAVFWTMRLYVALFVFDVRPYLTSTWLTLGYHATNIVFALLPVLYGWAAWKGGAP